MVDQGEVDVSGRHKNTSTDTQKITPLFSLLSKFFRCYTDESRALKKGAHNVYCGKDDAIGRIVGKTRLPHTETICPLNNGQVVLDCLRVLLSAKFGSTLMPI